MTLAIAQNEGLAKAIPGKPEMLGLMTGWRWHEDPKGLLFTLARYKHVAKLLDGYGKVLEVGCADGFGSRIVRQHVESLTAIDSDPTMIHDAVKRNSQEWPIDFRCRDLMIAGEMQGYDAAYALDVYEHIAPDRAPLFLAKMAQCAPVVIIGSPSIESQPYASPRSKEWHVNCRTASDLKRLMHLWFPHVFMFGMNDEVLHTGFEPMRHYNIALGVR
jgi:hypothetical protein